MTSLSSKTLLLVALSLPLCQQNAFAGVVINGTRVIYPAQAREVTVQIDNVGDAPSLVQSWVDTGDANQSPDNSDAPFLLTPPITRVEPGRSQSLRLVFAGSPLPANQESVFWLNVLDVPPSPAQEGDSAQNFLQVAFRSRIKLFYRPKELPGSASEAPKALRWSRQGEQLNVENPSAFHVTLAEIHTVSGTADHVVEDDGVMLAPKQALQFHIPGAADHVRFITINDYGGRVEHTAPLGGS